MPTVTIDVDASAPEHSTKGERSIKNERKSSRKLGKSGGSFVARALSIRSRRKQYAQEAKNVDAKHVAGPKKQGSGLSKLMSFGTRAKKYKGVATNAESNTIELSELLRQAAAGDPPLCDLSAHHQFIVLSGAKKNGVLAELARATKVQALMLHGLGLDDSNADAIAELLRANRGLGLLSLERNGLRESALLAIAAAANGHETLRELRVGEQQEPISTAAATALIAVMESTPSLLKLGLGTLRDDGLLKRLEAATMTNRDRVRQRRLARGEHGDEPPPAWLPLWEAKNNIDKAAIAGGKAPRRKKAEAIASKATAINGNVERTLGAMKAVDWAEEARRIAASEPPQFGQVATGEGSPKTTCAPNSTYWITGDGTWLRATAEERRGVVAAFALNTTITSAGFANAAIDDSLGALWGEVLQRNRTLTSLNLESNTLQTESIESLAKALMGTPALVELRLANQHKNFAQAVEATLADAIEANHRLTKLTVDLRSTHARDRIAKALDRNQGEARAARRSGDEVPYGPPTASNTLDGIPGAGGDVELTPLAHDAALNRAKGPQRKKRGKTKAGGARADDDVADGDVAPPAPSPFGAVTAPPSAAPAPEAPAPVATTEASANTASIRVTLVEPSVVGIEEPRPSSAPLPPTRLAPMPVDDDPVPGASKSCCC